MLQKSREEKTATWTRLLAIEKWNMADSGDSYGDRFSWRSVHFEFQNWASVLSVSLSPVPPHTLHSLNAPAPWASLLCTSLVSAKAVAVTQSSFLNSLENTLGSAHYPSLPDLTLKSAFSEFFPDCTHQVCLLHLWRALNYLVTLKHD